jgi:hypothetical protein
MRREPSLTFEGALKILGHYEPKWIEKVDNLLGGVILAGGATAGLVALGVTPLAPLAAFGLVWGWVEQKGLAVDLLTKAVKSVSGKLPGGQGRERRELIAAAHSAVVVATLFEALRDHLGKERYGQLRITDDEKISLLNQMGPSTRDRLADVYTAEIPAPSAARGFEENLPHVLRWQAIFVDQLQYFLSGLAVAEKMQVDWRDVSNRAIERYQSHYLELAAQVSEFAIWAQLGEHAATRTAISELGSNVGGAISDLRSNVADLRSDVAGLSAQIVGLNEGIATALDGPRDALGRVTALLTFGIPPEAAGGETSGQGLTQGGMSDLRAAVNRVNMGILEEPIIPADPERYPAALTIPLVSEIYVNPRYRVAELDEHARPSDDRWWADLKPHDDFDVLLARHVTAPDATRRPLVLLGHPGAGKSLLTKVFAARLPASQYTVVRVPLRRVSANARVEHQIEEALRQSTHRPIGWWELAEQSEGTTRVVLLDGLDELLQASEHDRSSYLQDVMDFQEKEALQQRPVVVVVTSRTVVADRVLMPHRTALVKLDPFSSDDITEWLGRWRRVNADAIAAGTLGELTASALRRQPELAEQPLLLLMLAIYAADLDLPPLDDDMSTAELYQRLLDGFARREAAKEVGIGHDPSPDEIEQEVQDQLDRLAIAALGMFNRGRQDIGEEELGKDIEAIEPRLMTRARPAEAGRRVIGSYFFIHAPEARTRSRHGGNDQPSAELGAEESRGRDQARRGEVQRAYEFLHATFGEYLVAKRVMDQLIEVTRKSAAGRRGLSDPEDDLLCAMLSHQVLAVRESMLLFALDIFGQLATKERRYLCEVLELLIAGFQYRHDSIKYASYQPVPPDRIRQLACYSANLVALRALFGDRRDGIPLPQLLRVPDHLALERWQSTVMLWKAGLDTDSMTSMLKSVELLGARAIINAGAIKRTVHIADRRVTREWLVPDILLARLVGDRESELRLRYGYSIVDHHLYYDDNDPESWLHVMASSLIPASAGKETNFIFLTLQDNPPREGDAAVVAEIVFTALRNLKTSRGRDAYSSGVNMLKFLFSQPRHFKMDSLTLAAVTIANPSLLDDIPELRDHEIFGRYAPLIGSGDRLLASEEVNFADLPDDAIKAIRGILREWVSWRREGWDFPDASTDLEY